VHLRHERALVLGSRRPVGVGVDDAREMSIASVTGVMMEMSLIVSERADRTDVGGRE
jgi:hypothetical protein